MKETGYHDVSIFDMVCNGIPLYGEHDLPPGAILDWRPATTSADELLTTSVWRRKAIQGASPELDPEHRFSGKGEGGSASQESPSLST